MHDIKSGDGLAASVLSVSHGVSDDVLKEDLEDTSGLLIDEARDALDTAWMLSLKTFLCLLAPPFPNPFPPFPLPDILVDSCWSLRTANWMWLQPGDKELQ